MKTKMSAFSSSCFHVFFFCLKFSSHSFPSFALPFPTWLSFQTTLAHAAFSLHTSCYAYSLSVNILEVDYCISQDRQGYSWETNNLQISLVLHNTIYFLLTLHFPCGPAGGLWAVTEGVRLAEALPWRASSVMNATAGGRSWAPVIKCLHWKKCHPSLLFMFHYSNKLYGYTSLPGDGEVQFFLVCGRRIWKLVNREMIISYVVLISMLVFPGYSSYFTTL